MPKPRHPELGDNEVFLLNVYAHETWTIPPWCNSVRKGKVAYSTNGEDVTHLGLLPLIGMTNY